jgi:polysaccharide export outer membrane protein
LGLSLVGAAAAGLMDVAKKWPSAYSTVPMAFFGALLPATAHVDAASKESERMQNLRELYLNSSRYSNLCTTLYVALAVFWSHAILHVWLGPELPMRQTLTTLFVVFSFALQFHMLTGPGTSLFRGMGKVYEEFSYSIPNVLLLGVTLPVSWWVQKEWTAMGVGIAVAVATVLSACVLLLRVHHVMGVCWRRYFGFVILPGWTPFLPAVILAWPVAWLVGALGRWQGAGVLLAAGVLYLVGTAALLDRWVLSAAEREKGRSMVQRAFTAIRSRGAGGMKTALPILLALAAASGLCAQQVPASANFEEPQPALAQPGQPAAKPLAQESPNPASPQLKPNPIATLREFQPEADEEYRLGRGDEIMVDFPGRPDLQAKLVIGPDGRITLPLAGEIVLNGLTRSEAARTIEAALAVYYQNLAAQVSVTKYTANHVLVLGAVEKPGLVTFEGQPTLLDALTRAGMVPGPARANMVIPERCAIYRGQDKVVWVELKKLIDSGNGLADLRLRRDDIVYVPSASENFVSVLGSVQHPGAVLLNSNSTLASVLAESGGFLPKAGNKPHIQIVDPASGVSQTISFNDVLDPVRSREIKLKAGEIIYVPETGFARATYVLERLSPLITAGTFAVAAGGVF